MTADDEFHFHFISPFAGWPVLKLRARELGVCVCVFVPATILLLLGHCLVPYPAIDKRRIVSVLRALLGARVYGVVFCAHSPIDDDDGMG